MPTSSYEEPPNVRVVVIDRMAHDKFVANPMSITSLVVSDMPMMLPGHLARDMSRIQRRCRHVVQVE